MTKKPKRVLFLAQTPPPHHGQSAIAALVRDVLEHDANMIIDQKWRGGAESNIDVGKKTLGKYFRFAGFLLELLLTLLSGRRYDLAYLGIAPWAHTALRDALLAGIAKRLSKRTWFHVHGNGLPELYNRSGVRGAVARWLLSGTEIIAITDEACQSARTSGLFARVLPLANMSADPGDQRDNTTDAITIACLGNLDPRKGVLDFVEVVSLAARDNPNVQAIIIGGETAQLSIDTVKARAATYGTEDRIQVTGWVTEERKTDLLSQTDIFLYLSRHDLAPVALIEALAHGCAPIVLDIGGLVEMVGPELQESVIDATAEPAALIAARQTIQAYLDDSVALDRDKARARKRYLDAYSPVKFKASILEFLAVSDDEELRHRPASPAIIENQTS